MEKHVVMRTGNVTIPGLNYLLDKARILNLGPPTGVYGHPPNDFGSWYKEWGVICEKGIVCSREEQDTALTFPVTPK
jgi:hypothetical protein